MSDGHDHDLHDDDEADAHHDDHGFDGEPAKELAPGEPLTPGWVPLVGAAIFVLGAVFLVTQQDDAASGAADPPATPQTVAQPQPAPEAQPARPAAQPARPAGSGLPNVRKLTPDQIHDLQKRIQDARKAKEAGGDKQ